MVNMNINGKILTLEEKYDFLKVKLLEIGINEFKITNDVLSLKKTKVSFRCSKCKKEDERLVNSLLCYKTNICNKCKNLNKGSHKKKNRTKNSLQLEINKAYENKENSFTVIEDFEYENNKQKIKVSCTNCHDIQESRIDLLSQGRKSCQCVKMRSKLEKKIEGILNRKNISFVREKTFNDLKNILKLRFDFYIEIDSRKIIIEADGIQHFYPTFGKEAFERTLKTDDMKNKYCKKNNIELFRISYLEINHCEEIISSIIQV